jgi:hypothetical protein
MNRLKKQSEKTPKEQTEKRRPGLFQQWITGIMDGSFLSGDATTRNIPFALFLCLLVGFYIANTYNAERTIRQKARITKELKDLRSEYITLKSELVYNSNPSQVADKLQKHNIYEAKEPPRTLYISKDNKIEPIKE